MNKLEEIKQAYVNAEDYYERYPEEKEDKHSRIGYLLSLLEEKDKALEEAITMIEDMVDEMAFLKSEFNVGDVAGTGLFSDADALVERAGDIIIKRNIARKALNTSSNSEGE